MDSDTSVKRCSQEVIVQHNRLRGVYLEALVLLDFSLSQAVSVMNRGCVGFSACLIHVQVIAAAFVNYDVLQHVGPELKGLTDSEISGLESELVTGC